MQSSKDVLDRFKGHHQLPQVLGFGRVTKDRKNEDASGRQVVLRSPTLFNPRYEHRVVPNGANWQVPLLRRQLTDPPFLFPVPQPPDCNLFSLRIGNSSTEHWEGLMVFRNIAVTNYLENPFL